MIAMCTLALAAAAGADTAAVASVCGAIAALDASPIERAMLVITALDESGARARVVDCRDRGDNGRARGAWQVHARSAREVRALCNPATAAAIALARVRESLAACGHLPPRKRLAGYASGRCASAAGQRISASRWRRAVEIANAPEALSKVEDATS